MAVDEHGLLVAEVGEWGEEKYDLIRYYAKLFTTSMKKPKWDALVYMDLFSGPGRARFKSTGEIVDASPLIALSVKNLFDRYVFCDIKEGNITALQSRVERCFPGVDARFVVGDCNQRIGEVLAALPRPGKTNRVLSLCMVDPSRMAQLKFNTIRCLSQRFIDFLVLVPSYMDANRQPKVYEKPKNRVVAEFVGNEDWRVKWAELSARLGKAAFGRFITNQFRESMENLGFRLGARRVVRRYENNMKLYELLGFSRADVGVTLWQIAKRETDPVKKTGQLSLFAEEDS